MRREDLTATARLALRPFSFIRSSFFRSPREENALPVAAIVAFAVGMLLAAALLAATQPGATAVDGVIESTEPSGPETSFTATATRSASAIPWLAAPAFGAIEIEPFDADDDLELGDEIDFSIESLADLDDEEIRWFNNRPIRPVKTLTMRVTAYSPDEQSCGIWADGITASGYSVWTNGMNLVAADTSILPFGSLVSVPGYDNGNVVPVLDRGGAIRGHRLDVLYPTHERALEWGVQNLEITIWEYADGKPNGFRQNHRRR